MRKYSEDTKMKKILFGVLLAAVIFEGCAAVTRFHDIYANVPAGAHYKKFIVHSDLADPGSRKTIEDSVVQQLAAIGVNSTPSYTIFPPDSNYTWPEKKQMIQADGFDAGLLVEVVDSYSKTVTQLFINHTVADFSTAYFKIQTKIVETSGFTVVWQGKSSSLAPTDDTADFSLVDIMTSYAEALLTELQNEGVVVGKSNE